MLVRRGHPPPGHALPGGFVDIGETVEHAARREAREETGLEVKLGELLGVYSDPARDPRGHTVAIVYVATARGEPVAGDDAAGILDHRSGIRASRSPSTTAASSATTSRGAGPRAG